MFPYSLLFAIGLITTRYISVKEVLTPIHLMKKGDNSLGDTSSDI
jgi:hypothetical protein